MAECVELGATKLIPEGPLPPGDIFSIGYDPGGNRVALFRLQVQAVPGSGRFKIVGITSKAIKESASMAYEYLWGNAKKIGLEHDLKSYDLNIQVMSPMQGKDTEDPGIVFFTAILSEVVQKNTASISSPGPFFFPSLTPESPGYGEDTPRLLRSHPSQEGMKRIHLARKPNKPEPKRLILTTEAQRAQSFLYKNFFSVISVALW